jgi:hypothetical protein
MSSFRSLSSLISFHIDRARRGGLGAGYPSHKPALVAELFDGERQHFSSSSKPK